jgi:sulfur relay (sulfurtransferase) DsrC/TusE family protein
MAAVSARQFAVHVVRCALEGGEQENLATEIGTRRRLFLFHPTPAKKASQVAGQARPNKKMPYGVCRIGRPD